MKISGSGSPDGIWSHDGGNKVGAAERMYDWLTSGTLPIFGAWEESSYLARLRFPSEPF